MTDGGRLPPIVYWIGNVPLLHGERADEDEDNPQYCLCGYPNYMMCPEAETGGIMSFVVGDEWGGRL